MCFLAYVAPIKVCSRCKEPLSWDDFSLDHTKPDGMNYICRTCDSLKQRGGYQRNHEHKLQYGRAWKKKHRARILRQRRARYWQNPEKYRHEARLFGQVHRTVLSAKAKQKRLADPEKYRRQGQLANARRKTKKKAWNQANLALLCLYASNRRARERQLPDTFTQSDLTFMLDYWQHACAVCGNQEGFFWILAQDHWICMNSPDCPGTVADNIIPLCHGTGGCNNSKGHRDPETWLLSRFTPAQTKRILAKIETYFTVVRARMAQQEGVAD